MSWISYWQFQAEYFLLEYLNDMVKSCVICHIELITPNHNSQFHSGGINYRKKTVVEAFASFMKVHCFVQLENRSDVLL